MSQPISYDDAKNNLVLALDGADLTSKKLNPLVTTYNEALKARIKFLVENLKGSLNTSSKGEIEKVKQEKAELLEVLKHWLATSEGIIINTTNVTKTKNANPRKPQI